MKPPSLFRSVATMLVVVAVSVSSTSVGFGQPAAGVRPATTTRQSPVATVERFRQALSLAKLAAEHDMHALSLRAVHESLAGGLPVAAVPIQTSRHLPARIPGSGRSGPSQQAMQQVQQSLSELSEIWQRRNFPPKRVYETLAKVVLPPSRPGEILLYAGSSGSSGQSGTVGRLLIEWARRAEQLDDLQRRLVERRKVPRAALSADVMLTELALAGGDFEEASKRLAALEKLLQQSTLGSTVDLAMQVAVVAFKNRATASAALPLVERAAENLARTNVNSAGKLLLRVARARFDMNDPSAGLKHLHKYLQIHQAGNTRNSPDSALHLRRQQLGRAAAEMLRGGQLEEALKLLGEFADAAPSTRYGWRSYAPGYVGGALVRRLAKVPPAERYRLLKDWSFPKPGRKSIRIFAAPVSETHPPDVFAGALGEEPHESYFKLPVTGLTSCVADTAYWLIDAAKEAGKLDELATETRRLAAQDVENAQALALLADIARGRGKELLPELTKLGNRIKKNMPEHREYSAVFPWPDYLVARACVADDQLRRKGNDLLGSLLTFTRRSFNLRTILFVQRDQAASQAVWNNKSFGDGRLLSR